MPHGALDGIEAFRRVAERRSFPAAAADPGVAPSAISQTIKALEARVGAPLFMRTTRSVGLTQAGEMFLERAAPAYTGLADAYEAARNLGNRPAGRLRINLMRGAVQPLFEPIIAGFCETHPEIQFELYADGALADLRDTQAIISTQSEEHTSALQSVIRHTSVVHPLTKKKQE